MHPPVKPKFPRALALRVARQLIAEIQLATERLVVAGSLRRGRDQVGDLELVYIPRVETRPDGLFDSVEVDLATEAVHRLIDSGILAKRQTFDRVVGWGRRNKFAIHVETGLPVDLFATTARCWANYLVCRTGPAALNAEIATRAKNLGWTWNPYGPGFTRLADDEPSPDMQTEEEVFAFVGLPPLSPEERGNYYA